MSDDVSPRVEQPADSQRLNGYLYRQRTRDFLFTADEWDDEANRDIINNNFTQDLAIDEEIMSQLDVNPPGEKSEVKSIHTDHGEEETTETEEDRLAREEEERKAKPFREFTAASYDRLVQREHELKLNAEKQEKEAEGRLVDGEIVFDDTNDDNQIDKDPKLADGQPLPEKLGRFPADLNGKPIEEIDKYIKEKSFVVVAKKFKKYHIFRFSATKSLFCFSPLNPYRRLCLLIISNQFFDMVILSTILINCFFMAIDINDQQGTYNLIKENIEHVFLAIYTAEFILKVSARGLILNKFTYLRDGWNWLDSIVVIISYVTLGMDLYAQAQAAQSSGDSEEGEKVQLQGLRAFRVMRTLKSISVVPGLRTIVNALLKSLKMLAEVMILTLFCIAVFALLALQLYKGVLRQKCVADIPATFDHCNATYPNISMPRPDLCFNSEETFKKYWNQDRSNYLLDDENLPSLCGYAYGTLTCPEGYSCVKAGDNPNWNYTHFDNFGWSMLNSFQLVTLDFWEDTYNRIIDVSGPWNILFFLLVVLLGSFYLINLMLAVVAMAYEQEADAESKLAAEEEEEEKAKAKRKENTALLFDPKKLKQQLMQKHKDDEEKKRREKEAEEAIDGINQGDKPPDDQSSTMTPNGTASNQQTMPKSNRPTTAHGQFLKTNALKDTGQAGTQKDTIEVTELEGSQDKLQTGGDKVERGHTPSPTKTQDSEVTASGVHVESNGNMYNAGPQLDENGEEIEDEDAFDDDLPPIDEKQRRYLLQKFAVLWLNKIRPDEKQLIDRNCLCCAKLALPSYHPWVKYQNMVFKVANDGLFELFITLCILVNTAFMATEHYERCELCRHCPEFIETPANATSPIVQNIASWNCDLCPADKCESFNSSLEDFFGGPNFDQRYGVGAGMSKQHVSVMEISNVVFTLIFTMEAIIKLTALSKEYFKVGWNVFDLIIVIFSFPDLVIFFGPFNDVQGLSALTGIVKIFRLMRIVKLAQSWSTFRTLLGIIFSTLGALLNLSIILIIIAFIFAVLGNQLLGSSYERYLDVVHNPELADYDGKLPRWHFSTFMHSFLMVFRILCGEWIEPLWDCMRVSSEAGCTFFFLLTLILGNFMVLNLFLALLLNAFSTDSLKQDGPAEGESKIIISLRRIRHCCCSNITSGRKKRAITPTGEANMGSGVISRPQTRLEAIIGDRKPSIAINGSTQSIRSLIKATNPPKHENGTTNVSDMSLSNGVELKPIGMNGHTRNSSRSGSIISVLSNGTGNHSNGILKNKNPEISPYNLQQIESAFSTQRDQYAKFETAVTAGQGDGHSPNSRTPIIIAEDFSSDQRKTLYIPEEQHEPGEAEEKSNAVESHVERDVPEEDNDEGMVAEDGHVIVPDCFCIVCYKNPTLQSCCGDNWHDFRLVCAKIITNKFFESFIMFLIAASSITLCFEDVYLHEKPELVAVLNYLNIVFAIFFLIEMSLKWLALGLKKYFTSFWTILDFLIVLVSIVDIYGTYGNLGTDISALRVLRTLRALRPLRAISRWEGMRIVVNALIFAMPAIGNVLLVVVVLWLIFVIFAVQTFRGRFFGCQYEDTPILATRNKTEFAWCMNTTITDTLTTPVMLRDYVLTSENPLQPLPSNLSECIGFAMVETISWARLCEDMGASWFRMKIHFDDLLSSYLALYQVATFEGWMEVMSVAVDIPLAIGHQPFIESGVDWYWFFVVFIIFGSFFTLNLFIGVIIDNFNVLKKKYDGSYLAAFLSDNERHYYNTLKKLGKKKPQKTIRRPKNAFQGFFYDIAVNTKFEITITMVIFLNMVVMMIDSEKDTARDIGTINNATGEFIQTHPPPPGFSFEMLQEALLWINYLFTMIFVVEAAIKIIGLRFHYFRRAWNVFDFVVVVLSVMGIALEWLNYANMFISPTLLRVVRVFRIGRVLRLVKAAKGIRKLLFALLISIPALINIATLLFLFMFIFAIAGMTLFSKIQEGGAITETVNFQTFGNSMVLLFRLATSAGWNDVLDPLQEEENCNSTHYIDTLGVPQKAAGGNCGNHILASLFLLFYLFVSFMVIINMYIAVILENFSQAHEQEEIGITEDDFDMFYVVWEKFDPHATQYIKLEDLNDFIDELEAPLGIPKPNGMAIVAFNLPIVEGDRLHCLDIMMALVKRVLHTVEEDTPNMSPEQKNANEKLKQQVADKYKEAFPQRERIKVVSTTMQRKKEDVAAKTLQRAWRKHKMKQNIMRIKELALEQSQRGSFSHRLSDAFGSIKSRIGSAVSRISRRGSTRSIRSIDSNQLNLPPEMRDNGSNRLSPRYSKKP